MDAFYVSVERRGNPNLIGKPVVVGADPKGGKGRGVVMAASYEARQLGVKSGMPISMAWHKLPQATYLRPNYDLYMAASESVIEVLRSFADVLEHVSIDEAFLDVTSKVHGFDDVAAYAARVKAAVQEKEGLACTIGVGPNKSIAKMASDVAKPDGLKIVRPEEVTAFLEPLPVTKISGVGPKTAQVLEGVGVRTIGELARFPGARAQGATFRTVGIKIRFEGFRTHLRERTLASNVLDETVLADVCVELAKEFAEGNHRFRLIGVRVTKLQRPKTRQPQLTAFELSHEL